MLTLVLLVWVQAPTEKPTDRRLSQPLPTAGIVAQGEPTRQEDIIYGRKHGLALTMDVVTPSKPNGAGVIVAVSGGFFSAKQAIPNFVRLTEPLVKRGYTVFYVLHGSQPRFSIPEAVEDMHRAVRFIRSKAGNFGIAPNRLAIMGGSAGGHLALMIGTTGRDGDPKADDPIDRASSRVQAVAAFFPPTDFLNYGKAGEVALGTGILKNFKAPFDFVKFDPMTRSFVPVTEEAERRALGRAISPAYHAAKATPPTLLIHGDADTLVPIQQSERMVQALEDAGAIVKLIVKPKAGHGWPDTSTELKAIADWFDTHLAAKQ